MRKYTKIKACMIFALNLLQLALAAGCGVSTDSGSKGSSASSATIAGSSVEASSKTGDKAGNPGDLPLLAGGKHLSMIIGFDSYPAEVQMKVNAKWEAAVAKGMDVARCQIEWSSLEPTPGQYDFSDLKTMLDKFKEDGLQPLVTIKTVDSSGKVVLPYDLQGKSFGDAEVIKRFQGLLKEAVPLLLSYNCYCLSVGNEPKGYLENRPDEVEPMAAFIAAARDYVHTLNPELAVTMTMDGSPGQGWFERLIKECDIACVNYYCLDPVAMKVMDISSFDADYDAILKYCGDKKIMFQEFGMPAGYESGESFLQSTPDIQKKLMDKIISKLQTDPRLRVVYWFQMMDWSKEATDILISYLQINGGSETWMNGFVEWIRTVGLCRNQQVGFEDVSDRPAWDDFLAGLDQIYGGK